MVVKVPIATLHSIRTQNTSTCI